MIIRGKEIAAKTIALVIAAVLLLVATIATLTYCEKQRSRGAQSRVERSQGEAASNSAADAIGTVARSGEASRASEDLTRSNDRDIRAAEGANASVNPAARDAGLTALCKRAAYREDPRCKEK
jgi:hypothetical protein